MRRAAVPAPVRPRDGSVSPSSDSRSRSRSARESRRQRRGATAEVSVRRPSTSSRRRSPRTAVSEVVPRPRSPGRQPAPSVAQRASRGSLEPQDRLTVPRHGKRRGVERSARREIRPGRRGSPPRTANGRTASCSSGPSGRIPEDASSGPRSKRRPVSRSAGRGSARRGGRGSRPSAVRGSFASAKAECSIRTDPSGRSSVSANAGVE